MLNRQQANIWTNDDQFLSCHKVWQGHENVHSWCWDWISPWLLGRFHGCWCPGPWFNIKMSSYQYRKSHCGDKTVVRSSYLHNGISYTGKMTSLYWIRALVACVVIDYDISYIWQLKYSFNHLLKLTTKQTENLCITSLCEWNAKVTQWIPFTKGQQMHGTSPYHDVIKILTSPWEINI